MPGHHRGERTRIIGRRVAAPGDVHIRPDQQLVTAIDRARLLIRNLEHTQRRPDRGERLHEPNDVRARAAKPKERIGEIVADA